jgi:hypothetical protein
MGEQQEQKEKWLESRKGKITASGIIDLMTSGRKKDELFGKTAIKYLLKRFSSGKVFEEPEIKSVAMQWGIDNEDIARDFYIMKYCIDNEDGTRSIEETGFIEYDDIAGCSPDGLVVNVKNNEENIVEGLIEIKCPFDSAVHIETLINKDLPEIWAKKYYAQMQMQMLVTGADWCDYVSFDPRMNNPDHKLFVKRFVRDDKFIEELMLRLKEAKKLFEDWDNRLKGL